LSIQIHYGDRVSEQNLGWHKDSPNSALHLALSLKNKRALYVGEISENGEGKTYASLMTPGDVYFSTPTHIYHGVEYPQTENYDDRIVAVQCRILLAEEEGQDKVPLIALEYEYFDKTDWVCVAEAVSKVTTATDFTIKLPTLGDIENIK